MRPATLAEVARVLEARLTAGDGGAFVRGAAADSRVVREGDLFFALRGRTDGADFASEAYLRGAVAAVATRPLEVPTLVVGDSLEAMQRLARWTLVRDNSPAPLVVGITGTVGKTTTKDALATVLRYAGKRVSATAGNFNNEIGLPLTVLAADQRTEILVLEMGATHPGDIKHLCAIAPPQVGILTAISPVHLDSFGSLEDLAAAKGELALALPEDGTLVSPASAPETATGAGRALRRITFDIQGAGAADLSASDIEEREEGLRFVARLGERSSEVRSPVFGTHLVEPLLAALGGALALGLDLEECARGVSRLRRTGLRGEVYRLRDNIVVYDDSYNASPAAVAAVLRYAAQQAARQDRRLVAVLGGMFELGATARAYHQEAGRLAEEAGVDLLVCVGDEARWYAEAFSGKTLFYKDAEEAAENLGESLQPGDYVIVKGSRGVGLDALTRKLKESLTLV
ncbi:MAG TPA: UDP-N-acetylmuramoyl-tripeptide--D-alanyl-D-alanine ligase [Rubrobacteraceae bacterium]|nr:UDP-N-acetylmuramoyl-tripeptide--D-alanyl-D-alanine ligase [Rubrobacteraceae bacterium]